MKLESYRQIFEKYSSINFMKIYPVGTDLFHADRRIDRRTKLIVNFLNYAKTP